MLRFAALLLLCNLIPLQAQTKPDTILKRIDNILAESGPLPQYPPVETVLRVFKREKQCEIWARTADSPQLMLVKSLPICAMDAKPGPKLYEGDGKTPEGFFEINFKHGFWSSQWFMWIDLDRPAAKGQAGQGSCFKTFVEYPTALDRFHTGLAGFSNPGGAIFAHGNCVSIGCVSFKNRDYLPVFAYSRHAWLAGGDHAQIQIYPFRFDKTSPDTQRNLAQKAAVAKLSAPMILNFWQNLETGFNHFNQKPQRLAFKTRLGSLKQGDKGPAVHRLKQHLKARNDYKGALNQVFGDDLKRAIISLQRRAGLSADGVVGPNTMHALDWLPPGYEFTP